MHQQLLMYASQKRLGGIHNRSCIDKLCIQQTSNVVILEVRTLVDISDARIEYELIFGRCSDTHWRNIQKILQKNQMDITPKNVRFFAEIRKIIPRSAIGVEGILTCYSKAEKLLEKTSEDIKGGEVLNILSEYGVKPHPSTVTRWFKTLGGYRKDRKYSPLELKPIFTSALIYKAIHAQTLEEISS